MADKYIDCDKTTRSTEQILREMIYEDAEGNPVLHTDPAGTALEPWFNCDRGMTLEQTIRAMILIDISGQPYLNTTS